MYNVYSCPLSRLWKTNLGSTHSVDKQAQGLEPDHNISTASFLSGILFCGRGFCYAGSAEGEAAMRDGLEIMINESVRPLWES